MTAAELFIKDLVTRNTEIRFRGPQDLEIKDTDIVVYDRSMFDRIITKGEIAFAETYMEGAWTCGNLEKLLTELLSKYRLLQTAIEHRFFNFLSVTIKTKIIEWTSNNDLAQASRNVQHHYDIGNDLYLKMLGPTMQYSCAYYYRDDLNLNEAQIAKMQLIAQKLDLQPGMKVLDIGCGFGALAHYLATNCGVKVLGVTLSKEQKKIAETTFKHLNVSIQLLDYRLLDKESKFDRIYSVGMFEHVGRNHYAEYYNKCYDLLTQDGIMLLHTIGTTNRNWDKNNFINTYIFPGAELPHLANLTEKYTDKWHLEDLHNFGVSYAKTLRAWRAKLGTWEGLDNYDSHFRRMWEFYLASCAAYFQLRKICLWQLVYTKQNSKRLDNCHHIRQPLTNA